MPIYQFRDRRTGEIREEFRHVADRDNSPPGFERVTVPQTVGYANASHLREPGAAVDVPKAFRDYELSGKSPKQIERESGFSRDAIRRIWKFGLAGLCGLSISASAADISPGYIFSAGEQNITHSKLNAVVGNAAVNTSFYSDKTTAVPASGDTFLFLSASAADFRKTDYSTLFLRNTNLITGQIEDTSPDPLDFLLTYNIATGLFNKTTVTNLLNALNTSNLLANASDLDVSNIYERGFAMAGAFTNLLPHTAPINVDSLLIWDSANLTNKQITLASLATNRPTATIATNGDYLSGYSTNDNTIAKFTVQQIRNYVTNAANSPTLAQLTRLPITFIGTNGMPATGAAATFTHSLGAVPQLVRVSLICTNADVGSSYAAGDEIEMTAAVSETVSPLSSYTVSSSAVVVRFNTSSTFQLLDKASGARTGVTSRNNFIVVCRAVFFPTYP